MRLIDADKLADFVCSVCGEGCDVQHRSGCIERDFTERCANEMPTVDATKHGHWIVMPVKEDKTADVTAYYEPIVCSVCGSQSNCESYYCPNCGAKMDEVKDADT